MEEYEGMLLIMVVSSYVIVVPKFIKGIVLIPSGFIPITCDNLIVKANKLRNLKFSLKTKDKYFGCQNSKTIFLKNGLNQIKLKESKQMHFKNTN